MKESKMLNFECYKFFCYYQRTISKKMYALILSQIILMKRLLTV